MTQSKSTLAQIRSNPEGVALVQKTTEYLRRVLDTIQENTSIDVIVSRNPEPPENYTQGLFITVGKGLVSGRMTCWAFVMDEENGPRPLETVMVNNTLHSIQGVKDLQSEMKLLNTVIDALNTQSMLTDLQDEIAPAFYRLVD